ncbi:protein FAR-RED IMPAIRED RESPONSE 1-like [Cicer arietinum]|uniref:protein FAR-RED IMPAIRED RESPONSE 1-like n=1 Tax=Cicer arietinum TaxID=3827 RepID=UPI003CC58E2C
MTKYKLAPRFILNALKERNKANLTIPSQIYKARSTYRSSLRGPYTEMQHLLKLIQQENYVYWTRRRENSDVLRDIFWTHTDCIKLLNTFHFVLICDSTYKTNRYRLPLLEIVGVTSTSLTFSVGFAYLEQERQDNFIWAFEKVRQLFKSETLISKVIVTDRDLAMMNAISVVFPTSIHLLCRFHIEKNVGARCKQYVKKDRQEEVMDLWKKIVYSSSVEEYDHHLQHFELVCADIILFVDYVKDSWLTPYKERFVNVWTNRVMHLGNTTSNRVESAHWRLKNMLQTSLGDLCKSWDAVNMMLKNQICIIQYSFQKTSKDVEHGCNSSFFQSLHHCVSRKCFKKIDKQLQRVKIVGTDKTICGCSIRTTHGLPCACELAKLQISGNVIPLDSIHVFWRTLSLENFLEDEESLSDYDFSEELEAMKAEGENQGSK